MKNVILQLRGVFLPLLCSVLFSTAIYAQSENLVVIDAQFSQKQDVLAKVPSTATILELSGDSNPWKAIRENLESNSSIKTIHLFVNATYNSMQMGAITYDLAQVNSENELSMLEGLYQGEHFQLLVYNCNLGSNDEGLSLLKGLGQKAYFNVGVSTDCTSIFDNSFDFNHSTLGQVLNSSIIQN